MLVAALLIAFYSPFDSMDGSLSGMGIIWAGYATFFAIPWLLPLVFGDEESSGVAKVKLTAALVFAGLTVGAFLFGSLLYSPPSSPLEVLRQSANAGDTVILSQDTVIFFTEDAWKVAHSADAVKAKLSIGEAGYLQKGTKVKAAGRGWTYREAVPLDGPFAGRTGRVATELLK